MIRNPMMQIILSVVLALLIAGCAGPKDLFVLMPSGDGHVGEVVVLNKAGEQTLNQAYQATEAASQTKIPSAPVAIKGDEAKHLFQAALSSHPAAPISYLLYFLSGASTLTAESASKLKTILENIKRYNSLDVSVIGHTDRVGTKEYNRKLSTERARAVAAMLIKLGCDPSIFEITSYGMEAPLVDTPSGVAEPRNRRVEVVVR